MAYFTVIMLSCVGFFISLLINYFLLKNQDFLMKSNRLQSLTGEVQAFHEKPTLRCGGLAVMAGFLTIFIGLMIFTEWVRLDLFLAILAVIFVFVAGLVEDFTGVVSPFIRLWASFASAALAIIFTGFLLQRSGVGFIDVFLAFPVVAFAITLLWSGGSIHAFNLIDGLNGLAGGYSIAAIIGIFTIAYFSNDRDIALTTMCLIGPLIGFLWFNWPKGRIFLGDGGAYALGHIIAWLGLILISRNSNIAPIALLLILFWPIADMLTAITRRILMRHSTGEPDAQHIHHLALKFVSKTIGHSWDRLKLNSMTSLFLVPFYTVPILLGCLLWDKPTAAAITLLTLIIIFLMSYIAIFFFVEEKHQADRRLQTQK